MALTGFIPCDANSTPPHHENSACCPLERLEQLSSCPPHISFTPSQRSMIAARSPHFHRHLDLHRHPQRQARHANHRPHRHPLRPKHITQQLRRPIRHPRLVEEVARRRQVHTQPHDPRHPVQRTKMLPRRRQRIHLRHPSRRASLFRVQLLAQPAHKCRLPARNRQHPAQKQQVARLHRLHIRSQRRRPFTQLKPQLPQPHFRTRARRCHRSLL